MSHHPSRLALLFGIACPPPPAALLPPQFSPAYWRQTVEPRALAPSASSHPGALILLGVGAGGSLHFKREKSFRDERDLERALLFCAPAAAYRSLVTDAARYTGLKNVRVVFFVMACDLFFPLSV